jgi:hypothetical protein
MAKKTTKPAAKKAATKTLATKKVAVKKVAVKKVAVKKVAVKKAAAARKAAPVKAATPAKKAAPVKAATPAKKAPAKKALAAKKAPTTSRKAAPTANKGAKTRIIARVDVGFGNRLYIRGEGAGLSWTNGTSLQNISSYEWAFEAPKNQSNITFKFTINDEHWADGENLSVSSGGTSISSPTFG